ncbi:MAG: MaoC/PaaZ C-terminal domain-containing protein, partial [Gammaproteobacteria bacterium]
MTGRCLEEFAPGQKFASGQLKVDRERIKSFAAEFDPQPFHLNEEAARGSVFKGLAASGWHTAAMTMRLLVESELKPVGGIVGSLRRAEKPDLRWRSVDPAPDELSSS